MRFTLGNQSPESKRRMVVIDGQAAAASSWSSSLTTGTRHHYANANDISIGDDNVDDRDGDAAQEPADVYAQFQTAMCDPRVEKVAFMRLSIRDILPDGSSMSDNVPQVTAEDVYDGRCEKSDETKHATNSLPKWKSIEIFHCTELDRRSIQYLLSSNGSSLERFTLSWMQGEEYAAAVSIGLGMGLKACSATMKYLSLSSIRWTARNVKGLYDGLVSMQALEELNLSYCSFSSDDSETIDTPSIPSSASAESTILPVQTLANAINQRLSSLRCLQLNRCGLEDRSIELLATALWNHPSIVQLYLGGNFCERNGCAALATLLHTTSSLKILGVSHQMVLRGNRITENDNDDESDESDESQHHAFHDALLGQFFPSLRMQPLLDLQVLHLGSNNLTDEHIQHLVQAFSNCHSIRHLDLKNNLITDRGASMLATHLPPHLRKLWLLGNPRIGAVGARSVLQVLRESRHLHLIDVRIPTYYRTARNGEMQQLQSEIQYYCRLNHGGRRLIEHWNQNRPTPIGIWAAVFGRVGRLEWERDHATDRGRIEVMYYLLQCQGAVILQQ